MIQPGAMAETVSTKSPLFMRLAGVSIAQARYAGLTGWKAPAAGGLQATEPTADGDRPQVRVTISRELRHEREQIAAVYLGR